VFESLVAATLPFDDDMSALKGSPSHVGDDEANIDGRVRLFSQARGGRPAPYGPFGTIPP